MPPVRRSTALRLGWRLHRWLYRASGGRMGSAMQGWQVLLLTTIGRRSGQSRTVALNCLMDGGDYVVAGSNAGDDNHPAWFLNLEKDPNAWVQVGPKRFRARARAAQASERQELWDRIVEHDPSYRDYATRTKREIPVVVLEPSGRAG